MTARSRIARPTEVAALRAVARSARPLPPIHVILADQHGASLCAHLVVRASEPKVGEA